MYFQMRKLEVMAVYVVLSDEDSQSPCEKEFSFISIFIFVRLVVRSLKADTSG